jgi:hypothetical protein
MALKLNPIRTVKGLAKYAPPPVPTVKPTDTKTKAYDYFTVPGETRLLYSAEGWVHARLLLQNAGPVSIGMDQNITPVLSGKGRLLPTGEEIRFILTKGDRIFIAAEAINRVSFTIEPLPPVSQIVALLEKAVSFLMGRK